MKKERVNKILTKMTEENISQAIISDPTSIFYLSGLMLHPGERLFCLLLDSTGEHKLFVNALFPIEQDLGIEKIIFTDTDDSVEVLANHLKNKATIGIDKVFPARFLLPLINNLQENKFTDISIIVDKIRMIKDKDEIEAMRTASRLNDKACQLVINSISKEKSELDVVKYLLAIHESLGVDGVSFDPIIGYGANGANPHGEPGERYLKDGDAIIIDMGGVKNNYCSDMTRTVFWKTPSEKAKEVFNIVLEAQKRAVSIVKPGVRFCDIDAACRDYITEKGYGEFFTHRTGHHIGLECHEYGDISSINETKCEPGMIFSIEPGIYLPGEFGVRIEDLVLVTEDGYENLNSLNKELVIIGE
ncbi:aminopeptidase P family protein [Gemella sp. GH3]|uniref:M24 family metallopeptidase n=1 Tax=unclassified Gemella TaxID=2624949 RepID=UPI0015D0AE54|nr:MULTISPECIES: Xaa-Pro peptidase family protein [unclassified Gemella]MBF0713347.1 aminopeptidase P family protein [Gemella sp. GH3.1]NYS50299.1 aminopeptidase P family protein [Gemella sp. GH3]